MLWSAAMNRVDLQKISELRIADAEALINSGRYEAAYYLAGYAIECALKACIAKKVQEHDFPDKKVANDSYTHDLAKLLDVAGIKHLHATEMSRNSAFAWNWGIVKDWRETSRYEVSTAEATARDFFVALTEPTNGVMTWLKKLW